MESIQMIRSRIQSIGSTRQITQSMRLVSTAKVQRARGRMEANRPFLDNMWHLVEEAVSGADPGHPFLSGGSNAPAAVVISSDRGLCGGYNINVCKEALALRERLGDCRIVTVGAKARDFFRRRRIPVARSFTGISESPFFDDARGIGDVVLDWFGSGEADSVYLVYTRFQTLLAQTPVYRKLLPLKQEARKTGALVRMEPEDESFLDRLVPFYLSSVIYSAMLESSACEQGARITSMDAAVKNSDEMIDSLTLLYNQARQGAITREITEIVGGAEALQQRGK